MSSPATTTVPFVAKRTPLYELHVESGAPVAAWQGFQIPSHYSSILDEHEAAVNGLALFDLGYRGFVRVRGAEAGSVLDNLATLAVSPMPVGSVQLVPFVYPDGTLVDLVRVARDDKDSWLLYFPNPAVQRAITWLKEQTEGANCWVDDISNQYAWVGLAGKKSTEFLSRWSPGITQTRPWEFTEALVGGVAVMLWRKGENFWEASCQPELLGKLVHTWWSHDEKPRLCGWASYENWQLEHGVLRYGYELKDGVSPFELGLDKKIDLSRDHFIGRSVLIDQQREGLKHVLIHFYIDAMRLPRVNAPIYCGDKMVGRVVAGGFGVQLKRPIGSAWVSVEDVDFDSLTIEIRRQRYAVIVKAPPLKNI